MSFINTYCPSYFKYNYTVATLIWKSSKLEYSVTKAIFKNKPTKSRPLHPPCSAGSFSRDRRPFRTWLLQTPSYWHKPIRTDGWEIPFSCNLVDENCTQQENVSQNKAQVVQSCFYITCIKKAMFTMVKKCACYRMACKIISQKWILNCTCTDDLNCFHKASGTFFFSETKSSTKLLKFHKNI